MKHQFIGSVIGFLILVIMMSVIYYVYRQSLAKSTYHKLKGLSPINVWSPSTFMTGSIIFTLTVMVMIIFVDVSISAKQSVSVCNTDDIIENVCLNNLGRQIYRNEKLVKPLDKNDLLLDTMLNVNHKKDLSVEQKRFLNARTYHNQYIYSQQNNFLLDNNLEINIMDNDLDVKEEPFKSKVATISIQITNHNQTDFDLSSNPPVGIYLKNKFIQPIEVDGYQEIIKGNETVELKYYYDVITEPYTYYSVRIHGDEYSFIKEAR